jgi:hypothetical protein
LLEWLAQFLHGGARALLIVDVRGYFNHPDLLARKRSQIGNQDPAHFRIIKRNPNAPAVSRGLGEGVTPTLFIALRHFLEETTIVEVALQGDVFANPTIG